jgi:hypothetical protein
MGAIPLGRVVATPRALQLLQEAGKDPHLLLARHRSGDWGVLDEYDHKENELALKLEWRIVSSYSVGEGRVWIITEANRSYTTILLPEEY